MGRNLYRRRPPLRESPAYASSGDPATRWYQELAPGGLTNHWTGAVPRFAAEDFVEGARLHESYRWPVGYADLEPYYDRVERLLGVAGDPRSLPSLPASRVRYRRRLPADWLRMARQATAQGQGLIPTPIADGKPWLITRSPTASNSYTVYRAQADVVPALPPALRRARPAPAPRPANGQSRRNPLLRPHRRL